MTTQVRDKEFSGLIDTGADVSIPLVQWPASWPPVSADPLWGIGGNAQAQQSRAWLAGWDPEGQRLALTFFLFPFLLGQRLIASPSYYPCKFTIGASTDSAHPHTALPLTWLPEEPV